METMARIIKEIAVEGKPCVALFDTGSMNTDIRKPLLADVPERSVVKSYRVALGGTQIEVTELCVALGEIDGLQFDAEAVPVETIGRADGHELGRRHRRLTMEKWEITLDPKRRQLGLDGLRRREFTEF